MHKFISENLIGKILTNCWKFVNIFPRQKFAPYGSKPSIFVDRHRLVKVLDHSVSN